MAACPACGCAAATHADAHAIVAALGRDDLDAAIEAGLLDAGPCPACAPGCRELLQRARAERLRALAARERYRARTARLARRAEARGATRGPMAPPGPGSAAATPPAPGTAAAPASLPPAAAAALARARARANGTGR